MNQIIHNFVVDGYLFHSFNAAFFDSIQSLGLSTEGRQWEAEEINEIRTIFSKHGFTGIFGLYRESKENPIFLANSLKSSVFYAYSSPTWFRHFVSGGMKGERNEYNKDAFFRRDYQSAKNNVLKLAHQAELDVLEQQKVLAFEKYWGKIASKEFPYIALIKRSVIQSKTLLLEPLPGETAHSFTKRYIRIYQDKNEIVKSNIPVEQLFLFPYDFSKIKELQIKDYPKNLK